ncbi:MAG: hypothetical protein WAR77_01695 [Saprospiraceae bacterium]|nr:hypothetical protein [Saprospiraceae bacterium]
MNEQRFLHFFYCYLFLGFSIIGCKQSENSIQEGEDPVIIKYGGRTLYYSEVLENTISEIQSSDSAQIVTNYAEKWVKDQIMLNEANKQIGNQKEIELLTETFRNELLLLKFEEKLIREKLDTLISDQELSEYYNSNKSRYKLESTIFRFIFVKVNKPISDSRNLENLWKNLNNSNLQMLNLYCQNNADICFLNPAKWYKWDEVKQHLPSKNLTENSIQAGISRDFADFNYAYKIKFFEVVHPNQDPPLSFFKDQATQAILHKRKIKLLDQFKSNLYETELKSKRIQFLNK